MQSRHLYLYIASNKDETDSICFLLLHNHKSRENYKQTITKGSQLKIKSESNFLVINNKEENIWLWFSFPNEKANFAKGMRSFCSRNGVRLEFISNENDDIFEEDNEEPQIEENEDPQVEQEEFLLPQSAKNKENLMKFLDTKEVQRRCTFNFANLINFDSNSKEDVIKAKGSKVDDLFNKIYSKHNKPTQPNMMNHAPRENLASMLNKMHENTYPPQTFTNYSFKNIGETENPLIKSEYKEKSKCGNLIGKINKMSSNQSSENYQNSYLGRTNIISQIKHFDNNS